MNNINLLTDSDVAKIASIILAYSKNQNNVITIPESIEDFPLYALNDIYNKSELILPKHLKSFGGFIYGTNFQSILICCNSSYDFSFRKMESLKTVTFKKRMDLGTNAFLSCPKLETVNFENGVKNISEYAFNNCPMLKKIVLNDATYISRNFIFGCYNVEHIEFPKTAKIEKYISFNSKLRYLYIDNRTNNYVFCKDLPDKADISKIIDLRVFTIAFGNQFSITNIMQNENQLFEVYTLAKELIKKDVSLNEELLFKLIQHKKLKQFVSENNFLFFKNEIGKIHKNYSVISSIKCQNYEMSNSFAFISFASALGCFSSEHLKDNHGKILSGYFAQKACTFLSALINANQIPAYIIPDEFENNAFEIKPSQAFLDYVAMQDEDKTFPRFKKIIEFETEHNGFLFFIMQNFEKILQNRTIIYKGKLKKLSVLDACKYFFTVLSYSENMKENENLAKLFMIKGVSEKGFSEATRLIKEANDNNIPEHILGKQLDENNLTHKQYNVKLSVNNEFDRAKKALIKMLGTQFTFEMLSKKDDRNLIIGAYTSCCATIDSEFYGKTIASKAVTAPDVQNMVVKDSDDNIIGKATIFLNTQKRYAVINEFEIDEKYRKHESIECGLYNVSQDSIEEIEREAIFYAFMRGIYAFVEEYNRANPQKPLLQVNVGMENNKLKLQCTKYMRQTLPLYIPEEYRFNDAEKEQQILYCKDAEPLME